MELVELPKPVTSSTSPSKTSSLTAAARTRRHICDKPYVSSSTVITRKKPSKQQAVKEEAELIQVVQPKQEAIWRSQCEAQHAAQKAQRAGDLQKKQSKEKIEASYAGN